MASYEREQVNRVLPVQEMEDRFQKEHGLKARFFETAIRWAIAGIQPPPLDDVKIDRAQSNLGHQWTRFVRTSANGGQDTLSTGMHLNLEQIADAWRRYTGGEALLAKRAGSGNSGQQTSGSTSTGNTPNSGGTSTTPAQPGVQVVPFVTPNIVESVSRAADAVRNGTTEPPQDKDGAYALLWEHLDPQVREGRASGVISDTLHYLATGNRELFNGIITVLPDDVQASIMEVLQDRAAEQVNKSLKNTVDAIFHIQKRPAAFTAAPTPHSRVYFEAWGEQVRQAMGYITRDMSFSEEASPEQVAEGFKITALAALKALYTDLAEEVRASGPAPATVEKLGYEVIVPFLSPEQVGALAGTWATLTADKQHEMLRLAREEKSKKDAAAAQESSTTSAETPAQGQQRPAGQPRQGR